jgi:stress 70 chaperone-associated protein
MVSSETTCSIIGGSLITLLIAGYFGQQFLPAPKPKIIGLDLGTTYSCVGIYHAISGLVEIIPAQRNRSCMPSIVSFLSNGTILLGYDAFDHLETNPKYTIYDAKRFIGKNFSPESMKKIQKDYPFELIRTDQGLIEFVVSENGTRVTPEQIGSFLLNHLKGLVEKYLQIPKIKLCVLSVPAEFNDQQRQATKRSAELAQLKVERIISEPTAAALAYGLHKLDNVRYVLVIDIGGGTTDVSLLSVQGGMFSTQAMAGNNRLGGQDFNQNLLNYILNLIDNENQKNDPNFLQHLRIEIEKCKLDLSSVDQCLINSQWLITRDLFEEINQDLFQKILEPLDRIFSYINSDINEDEVDDISNRLTPNNIDEIVLVGGSTRMLKIRQLIENYFQKKPNIQIDPDVAVTHGVSIQAGILGGVWPLTVSATEVRTAVEKIHIET